jgi:hypothetical protein
MNDTELVFQDILTLSSICIPEYQRAYSWDEEQFKDFENDLLEQVNMIGDSQYYYGHFIFENVNGNRFEIIDGQQRLITAILFLAACRKAGVVIPNNIDSFFKNITATSYDQDALDSLLRFGVIENISTSSQQRMNKFINGGKKSSYRGIVSFIEKNYIHIERIVSILLNSNISMAFYSSKAVAAQIFELHNTRGIDLTETEKVKSYLMKQVYLSSEKSNKSILKIQESFSKIYKLEQMATQNWIKGEMNLDNVMMYHLRAYDDGSKVEHYNQPNQLSGEHGSLSYVKEKVESFGDKKSKVVEYAIELSSELARTMEIVSIIIPRCDRFNSRVGDIILLDKDKSLIFLIRLLRTIADVDPLLLKRWEVFLFCYHFICQKGIFYNRDYRNRGNFDLIYREIDVNRDQSYFSEVINDFFVGNKTFANVVLGANEDSIWSWAIWYFERSEGKKNNKKDTEDWLFKNAYGTWFVIPYLLYKFEIERVGSGVERIRKNIIKANQISIDHIIAQESEEASSVQESINGIGNLAPISTGDNASLGNGDYRRHAELFNKLGLTYTAGVVMQWNGNLSECIESRGKDIMSFTREYFLARSDLWHDYSPFE